MALQSDYWVGIGRESVWGTPVTPSTFLFGAGKLALEIEAVDGRGYRPGYRAVDSGRHTIVRHKVGGSITDMDAVIPGGLKQLLDAVFGSFTVGVADATAKVNQFLFAPITSDCLPSYTIQQSTPRVGCGTASDAATFAGCQCSSLKFSAKSGELVGIETSWVGKSQSYAIAAAVPSYPASVDQLAFSDGTMTWGGTVVNPTAIALATGGTVLEGVTDLDLEITNGLDDNPPTLGSGLTGGRPALIEGKEFAKGSFTREYLDRTLIDDAISGVARPMTLTFKGRGPSATAPLALQFVMPEVVLTKPASAEPNDAKVISQKHEFQVLQKAGVPAVWAVLRSLEV